MNGAATNAGGVLSRCHALAARTGLRTSDLAEAVAAGDPSDALAFATPDPSHPYGRRVLIQTPELEGMIATWTRAFPCAPHDHGGSEGVVRVLQGALIHRMWRVEGGRLVLVAEERNVAGDLLYCGAHLVHSMVDAGDPLPLVTLHLYHDPITHMVVYDRAVERTYVVQGKCGAWVPVSEPELIRSAHDGLLPPEAVEPLC
jgi:cysteine dioxygenase